MDDSFNFDGPKPKRSGSGIRFWDFLSIIVLLITVCVGVYFLLIFSDPDSALNPLKPVEAQVFPTPTITPLQLEPTWTPTPTIVFTPTATLRPSITPPLTDTPANFAPPTNTATETATPETPFSASSVNAIESIIIPHLLDSGCNWLGVGGTVDDQNSSPIIGIVVRLSGRLNDEPVELTTVSGISPEYGKSGFEFVLGDTPIASNDKLSVQLLDQAGLPLSGKVFIDTYEDCKKNLILVRFKKNR